MREAPRRLVLAGGLLTVLAVAVAACGGGGSGDAGLPASTSTTGAASQPAPAATTTITTTPGAPGDTVPPVPGTKVYRWGDVGDGSALPHIERREPRAIRGIPGKVVQVATSNSDGYALTSTGQVFAWGANNVGELGDGRTAPYSTRAVRVHFPAGVRIRSLPDPMPFDGGLAIDSTGHAWGWGENPDHDLCLNGPMKLRPHRLPLSGVTLGTGARSHVLLYARGRLYSCGSGVGGVLGNGSYKNANRPTPVIGLPRGVPIISLTSSWEGSGALLANGAYYNWGFNANGQLGDGTRINSAIPVKVQLPAPVLEVSQGGSLASNGQTIVRLTNGSIWTWGSNSRGQLGNGTRTSSDLPVQVLVPAHVVFISVHSGGSACYAIDSSGQLWAWGDNRFGQLGTGSARGFETRPVDVGLHLAQVSATSLNVAGLA